MRPALFGEFKLKHQPIEIETTPFDGVSNEMEDDERGWKPSILAIESAPRAGELSTSAPVLAALQPPELNVPAPRRMYTSMSPQIMPPPSQVRQHAPKLDEEIVAD